MTKVCAPIQQWPKERLVDLYEMKEGNRKVLYGKEGEKRFVDIDWEEKETGDIVSYHNFEKTPELEGVLEEMKRRHPGGQYYKIATFARSTLDALRMLHFQKKHREVIGVCMGEMGVPTRILGPVVGTPIVYAPLTEEERSGEGQLLWSELDVIYRFREMKEGMPIYGLIGDPIRQSVGHLFHNGRFLYVKMRVKEEELGDFFRLMEGLPFKGLSVTAPLKEKVVEFLSRVSQEVRGSGAANTVVRKEWGWEGFNTDGEAAVGLLGNVRGKKVVVLGAGGSARAIVYELLRRGAEVTVVNRTEERGRRVARELGCAFEKRGGVCDVMVNTTPCSEVPILAPLVMDIRVHEREVLKRAKEAGSRVIDGMEMYVEQAIAQQRLFAE